jgi:hypothetical protein
MGEPVRGPWSVLAGRPAAVRASGRRPGPARSACPLRAEVTA